MSRHLQKIVGLFILLSLVGQPIAFAQQSAVQNQTYYRNFVREFIRVVQIQMKEAVEKLSHLREEAAKAQERMIAFSLRLREQSRQTKEKSEELRRRMQENSERNRDLQQRNQDLMQLGRERTAGQKAQMEALRQTQKDLSSK